MNKEQFFKAIDNVDDELLKGVFDDSAEELPDAESQHGAVYRPERRSRHKTFIAAAACMAAVVGTGLAVKAGVDSLPARNASYIESPADASADTIESSENNTSLTLDTSSFPWYDYISEDGLRGDEWYLSMGCMTYVSFSEDDDPSPFSPTPLEISEPQTVTAFLKNSFNPDHKMPQDIIPYRIFVFADGKPIEFAPAGTDDYALWHDYSMDENNISKWDHTTERNDGTIEKLPTLEDTINIDFKADESTHIINFVYCFFPELCQPHSWLAFSGMDSAMAVNTAYVPGAPAEIKHVGEYVTPDDPKGGTGGCDYLYIADDYRNAFLWKDLEYSEQSNTFYIEFNSGKKRDNILGDLEESGSYYLFLLIDGELQPAFDGDYSCFVDCENGTRTFKYQIPPELLPTSGKHTIQYMAIPAEECSYSCGETTPRIRIAALSE